MTARSWGISPADFWGMTVSEILLEATVKNPGETYADGMTEADIDDIKTKSADLRARMAEARKKHGAAVS